MSYKQEAYYRNRQGEEKEERTTPDEMATAILEIIKHHDVPIGWACILTNLEGCENAYEGLCLLLERKQIKREWSTQFKHPRKVFTLTNSQNETKRKNSRNTGWDKSSMGSSTRPEVWTVID